MRVGLAALVLLAIGFGTFFFKVFALSLPIVPEHDDGSWLMEATVAFSATGKSPRVSMFLPQSSRFFEIDNEVFRSGSFGLATINFNGNRKAMWTSVQPKGQHRLSYTTLVSRRTIELPSSRELTSDAASAREFTGRKRKLALAIVEKSRQGSTSTEEFFASIVDVVLSRPTSSEIGELLGEGRGRAARLNVAARILSTAQMPTRVVHGVRLDKAQRSARLSHWLEIKQGGSWTAFSTKSKQFSSMQNYFPWWRGSEKMIEVSAAADERLTIAVTPSEQAIGGASKVTYSSPFFNTISLTNFPVQAQAVYRLILLLPLAALTAAFLRNVIGIRTIGTFMPVLIALSFRDTELIWGLTLFCSILCFGLSFRWVFERLKLLLVPRLSATLTVVIIGIVILGLLAKHLEVESGIYVGLFPIVIITMVIERLSIIWEETGFRNVLIQGLGSLVVALLSYPVVTSSTLEYLFFTFPELLFVVLACALLLGRYTGYRLSELIRFRVLSRSAGTEA